MKKVSLIFIMILISNHFSYSMNDSTKINRANLNDSTIIDTTLKADANGFDLILFGGAGITTGFNDNDEQMKKGAISGLGIEVPLNKSNDFSIELYSHYWISKVIKEYSWINLENYYNKINNDFYSQFGLSASLKCYPFSIGKRLRFSCQIGWLFYCPKMIYRALDVGFGLYYKLTDVFTISLNRRISYVPGEFLSNSAYSPNSILLMINYKFNVKY